MTWYDNNWNYRKPITINNNSGGALNDHQVKIIVTYISTKMQTGFGDIRFAYTDGTNISYWLESKTDSSTATVWIKVNLPNYGTSPTGDNTVYMYYGNAGTTSASDGINTFQFFEDFESYTAGATINGVNNWTVVDVYGGGSLTTVETDYAVFPGTKSLRIGATSSGNQRNDANKLLPSKLTDDIIIEFNFRTTKPAVHYSVVDSIRWNYTGCCSVLDGAKLAAGTCLGRGYASQGDDFIYHQPDGTVITTYAADTWYKLRVDVLFSTKKSSHYINDTRYTTNVDFSDVTVTGITNWSSWRYSYGNAYYTWVDNIRIRKYTDPEPIVSTIGTEEIPAIPANIIATNMTITKNQDPCISGTCIVTVVIRWSNSGGTDGSVIPNIKIDNVSQVAHASRTVIAGNYIDETFTVSDLSTGTHTVCPDPN